MGNSRVGRLVGLLLAVGVAAAACSDGNGDSSAAEEPAPTVEEEAGESPGDEEPAAEDVDREVAPGNSAEAALAEVGGSGVSGSATLTLDPDAGLLTVTVDLDGVEEGGRYRPFIAPDCGPGSGHVHLLDDITGGADGTAGGTTEINGVDSIDTSGGWSIKVARPPLGPQACGPVVAA